MTPSSLKKAAFLVLMAVLLSAASPPVSREDFKTPWLDHPQADYTKWRKLGRGANNILLGWAEVVYQPARMIHEGNSWPVAIFGGSLRGVFYFAARLLAGAYEVVTFPFENPGGGYWPIIEPESIIPRERLNEYQVD
ncbi:MAG TPA: exosortase system-associated protein, TIGR04073 family [Verrucomicrobiae bacterium]|nr:exosortase system-associated protein, TIGR04073 family [Verrucomicrobiae bacterium]